MNLAQSLTKKRVILFKVNNMNILQIGTTDNAGGAASISWSLKKGLEKKNYRMPMFVSDKRSNDADVSIIPRRFHRYFHFLLSNDIDFSETDWILNTKEFKEADVVHLHNLHGWFFNLKTLEKISKLKPVVWTLHDMWAITPHCAYSYNCSEDLKNGFYQCPSLNSYPRIAWHNEKYLSWRKKTIYNNSKLNLIVPSLWLKNKISKSVLQDKKISLIYNGIDENVFKISNQIETRQELKIPLNKKIILFLSDGGKNNEFKGWNFIESVVKYFKNNSNILFLCLGGNESGTDNKYNNLLYIPKINDKKKLSKYFSISDIFLFPSLADNCPLVILEAMACGVPIVTFNTGGIPELVKHLENGYISKYKNAKDLIAGVDYILNLDSGKIDNIRNKSRSRIIANFTVNKMVNQYEELYKKIFNNFNKC